MTTLINGEWPIELLPHRHAFHETHPRWEWERLHSMHANLKPGMTIVDCGAEEGDLPALWGTWGCDVILVEPSPGYWPAIRQTFELNRLVPLGCLAGFASREDVWPHLNEAVEPSWPDCSIGEVRPDFGFRHLGQDTTTPRASINDIAVRLDVRIDAITIDVEGAEHDVLAGATGQLAAHRPLVWVSIHTDEPWMRKVYPGKGRDAVHELMRECGYEGVHLATDHEEHTFFYPSERAREVVLP